MIGEAKAMGAVSVVNAIACGKGATVSVKLPTAAKLELDEERGRWRVSINGKKSTSALALLTVRRAIKKLGRNPDEYSGTIQTTTATQIGVGLKTSSSSSVAIALAAFSAFGKTSYKPRDILDCSVSASLAAGVSVTGALDDAASCLFGGANFADNSKRIILSSARLGRELNVVIKVPRAESRRASVSPTSVRKFSKVAESIFRTGIEGNIWKAMTLNGLLCCSIYDYPSSDALGALETGAVGAGLSGTGPAVAAIFDGQGDSERLAKLWEEGGARVIRTETSNGGATIGR